MPSTIEMEQVTPNVFTNTKLRGCNPSFVVTSDGGLATVIIHAEREPLGVVFSPGRGFDKGIVRTTAANELLRLTFPSG